MPHQYTEDQNSQMITFLLTNSMRCKSIAIPEHEEAREKFFEILTHFNSSLAFTNMKGNSSKGLIRSLSCRNTGKARQQLIIASENIAFFAEYIAGDNDHNQETHWKHALEVIKSPHTIVKKDTFAHDPQYQTIKESMTTTSTAPDVALVESKTKTSDTVTIEPPVYADNSKRIKANILETEANIAACIKMFLGNDGFDNDLFTWLSEHQGCFHVNDQQSWELYLIYNERVIKICFTGKPTVSAIAKYAELFPAQEILAKQAWEQIDNYEWMSKLNKVLQTLIAERAINFATPKTISNFISSNECFSIFFNIIVEKNKLLQWRPYLASSSITPEHLRILISILLNYCQQIFKEPRNTILSFIKSEQFAVICETMPKNEQKQIARDLLIAIENIAELYIIRSEENQLFLVYRGISIGEERRANITSIPAVISTHLSEILVQYSSANTLQKLILEMNTATNESLINKIVTEMMANPSEYFIIIQQAIEAWTHEQIEVFIKIIKKQIPTTSERRELIDLFVRAHILAANKNTANMSNKKKKEISRLLLQYGKHLTTRARRFVASISKGKATKKKATKTKKSRTKQSSKAKKTTAKAVTLQEKYSEIYAKLESYLDLTHAGRRRKVQELTKYLTAELPTKNDINNFYKHSDLEKKLISQIMFSCIDINNKNATKLFRMLLTLETFDGYEIIIKAGTQPYQLGIASYAAAYNSAKFLKIIFSDLKIDATYTKHGASLPIELACGHFNIAKLLIEEYNSPPPSLDGFNQIFSRLGSEIFSADLLNYLSELDNPFSVNTSDASGKSLRYLINFSIFRCQGAEHYKAAKRIQERAVTNGDSFNQAMRDIGFNEQQEQYREFTDQSKTLQEDLRVAAIKTNLLVFKLIWENRDKTLAYKHGHFLSCVEILKYFTEKQKIELKFESFSIPNSQDDLARFLQLHEILKKSSTESEDKLDLINVKRAERVFIHLCRIAKAKLKGDPRQYMMKLLEWRQQCLGYNNGLDKIFLDEINRLRMTTNSSKFAGIFKTKTDGNDSSKATQQSHRK